MKMTGIFMDTIFYKTWRITNDGVNNYIEGYKIDTPDPVQVIEMEGYRAVERFAAGLDDANKQLKLDLTEMTAKYEFMKDSAQQNAEERNTAEKLLQKYMNYYSAERVTTMVQAQTIADLQAGKLELWGINIEQLLSVIQYYEMQTGEDPRKIVIKD